MRIDRFTSEQLDEAMVERILAFDRANMEPLLQQWGIPFPEEKRRRGLRAGCTLCVATDDAEEIAGYIQYGADWSDPRDIYIGSLQVSFRYRGSSVFRRLIATALADLVASPFRRITSNVQKENAPVISICRRLGFAVHEDQASATSYPVSADRSILDSRVAQRLSRSGVSA